jgi:hypothetical protein
VNFLESGSARAGNRRFWLLSALRAHTKAPYKTDLHRKTLMALKRPRAARTVEAPAALHEDLSPTGGAPRVARTAPDLEVVGEVGGRRVRLEVALALRRAFITAGALAWPKRCQLAHAFGRGRGRGWAGWGWGWGRPHARGGGARTSTVMRPSARRAAVEDTNSPGPRGGGRTRRGGAALSSRVKVTWLAQKLGQLEAVDRGLRSKFWANLKLLGQPCNFYTTGPRPPPLALVCAANHDQGG